MLEIIYEDNQIIVVLKPQNILSQGDITEDEDLLTMVKNYIKEKYQKPGNVFVGLVHRLDRPTGGVMVFAKNSKSASRLSEQIREGELSKKYLAVVVGSPREKTGELKHYLKKDEKTNIVTIVPQTEKDAKYAELKYEVLENKDDISLVGVQILTGRSHQIRVQLASLKTPIFGDSKYGGDKLKKGYNLALWAYELSFVHPTTKEKLVFKCEPPKDMIPWKFFNIDKFLLK